MITTHGHFTWNERLAKDVEAVKSFYEKALGWTFDGMPMSQGGGTYWVAKANGEMVGGLFSTETEMFKGVPDGWMSYIAVDDVDARAAKATKAGAKLMRPIFDVPEVGRIAILTEPGGAGIGWMTPVKK
jgi:predicted enzyme related to lactoylglutathione lyase